MSRAHEEAARSAKVAHDAKKAARLGAIALLVEHESRSAK